MLDGDVHRGDHIHAQLNDARRPAAVRKARANLVEGAGNLHHYAVHVGVFLEFELRERIVLGGNGIDIFHMGNRTERALHHGADLGLDTLRTRARVGRDDH